jgi:hypothetical protein
MDENWFTEWVPDKPAVSDGLRLRGTIFVTLILGEDTESEQPSSPPNDLLVLIGDRDTEAVLDKLPVCEGPEVDNSIFVTLILDGDPGPERTASRRKCRPARMDGDKGTGLKAAVCDEADSKGSSLIALYNGNKANVGTS